MFCKCQGGKVKQVTHHGHLVRHRRQRSIFNAVSEEPKEHIEAVKCQGWEYPGRSVDGMVANRDEKCDKSKDAKTTKKSTLNSKYLW